jgi:glycosyltransferase involved in cell wall biosynthesis
MSSSLDSNLISVVTGFSKSHLLFTIKLLHERNLLDRAIVPLAFGRTKIKFLDSSFVVRKATQRFEDLQEIDIDSLKLPEIPYQLSRFAARLNFPAIEEPLRALSFDLFSRKSNKLLESKNPSVSTFLVRAGFGGKITNSNGLFVSDVSIAHPLTISTLIAKGEFGLVKKSEISQTERLQIEDAERADRILVNSEFVKESYLFAGYPEEKINVVYLPPLRTFTRSLEEDDEPSQSLEISPKRKILFVGGLEPRKGISFMRDVADALAKKSSEFELQLVGNWDPRLTSFKNDLLSRRNVHWIPWTDQRTLRGLLKSAELFIFPSFAEGGARVVTEAMALGIPVVTTKNAGSPITDGLDGLICRLSSADLLEKIFMILENRELGLALGSNAKLTIKDKINEASYLAGVAKACSDGI